MRIKAVGVTRQPLPMMKNILTIVAPRQKIMYDGADDMRGTQESRNSNHTKGG